MQTIVHQCVHHHHHHRISMQPRIFGELYQNVLCFVTSFLFISSPSCSSARSNSIDTTLQLFSTQFLCERIVNYRITVHSRRINTIAHHFYLIHVEIVVVVLFFCFIFIFFAFAWLLLMKMWWLAIHLASYFVSVVVRFVIVLFYVVFGVVTWKDRKSYRYIWSGYICWFLRCFAFSPYFHVSTNEKNKALHLILAF